MSPDAQSEDTHEVSGSESVGERENGKGSSERKFTSTLWQLGMWLCVHCTCCVCVCVGGEGVTLSLSKCTLLSSHTSETASQASAQYAWFFQQWLEVVRYYMFH